MMAKAKGAARRRARFVAVARGHDLIAFVLQLFGDAGAQHVVAFGQKNTGGAGHGCSVLGVARV